MIIIGINAYHADSSAAIFVFKKQLDENNQLDITKQIINTYINPGFGKF